MSNDVGTAVGIIYDKPPENESQKSHDPERAFEELTVTQLDGMVLKGKPVYIEHQIKDEEGNCCKVGSVVEQFKTKDNVSIFSLDKLLYKCMYQ